MAVARTILTRGHEIKAGEMLEKIDCGDRIAMDVKVGDVVLFAKYSGTEIKMDGKKYLIMRESDLLGIVG